MSRFFQFVGAVLVSLSLFSGPLGAVESSITVTNVKARATFAMATTGAAYLTVSNHSAKDNTLVRASVASDVAEEAQLHTSLHEDGMMKMRQMTDGILIPAHSTVEFVPGGYHVMIMGLKHPLEAGTEFELTLFFADSTQYKVVVPVVDMSKAMPSHHQHHE
jgi:copper(I)-binding protein